MPQQRTQAQLEGHHQEDQPEIAEEGRALPVLGRVDHAPHQQRVERAGAAAHGLQEHQGEDVALLAPRDLEQPADRRLIHFSRQSVHAVLPNQNKRKPRFSGNIYHTMFVSRPQ